MLKHGTINPLNVHGLRRVNKKPPHFLTITFDLKSSSNEKPICDWIYENLEGRFYAGPTYKRDELGKPSMSFSVAFEIHSEASYFTMFLDQINTSPF